MIPQVYVNKNRYFSTMLCERSVCNFVRRGSQWSDKSVTNVAFLRALNTYMEPRSFQGICVLVESMIRHSWPTDDDRPFPSSFPFFHTKFVVADGAKSDQQQKVPHHHFSFGVGIVPSSANYFWLPIEYNCLLTRNERCVLWLRIAIFFLVNRKGFVPCRLNCTKSRLELYVYVLE